MSRAAQATADAFRDSYQSGVRSAFTATGGASTRGTVTPSPSGSSASPGQGAPAWANDLKRNQSLHNAIGPAIHAVGQGDAAGGGHAVDLKESQ